MSDDAKKVDEVLEEEVVEETSDEQAEETQAEEKVEEQEEKLNPEDEALNERYLRLMADFQNFKRRTEKEKSDIYAFANEKIVSELLNVIDNFERALAAATEGDSFAEGIKLIFKPCMAFFRECSISTDFICSNCFLHIFNRFSSVRHFIKS